jgi:hypothetical protein
MQWHSRFQEALVDLRASPTGGLLWAKQVTERGAMNYAFATVPSMIIERNAGASLYAMADLSGEVYPYFDIDIRTETIWSVEKKSATIEECKAEIRKLFAFRTLPYEMAVYDASTDEKISFHVHCSFTMGGSDLRHLIRYATPALSALFDQSVYSQWRCFRLPWCSKLGKQNKLMPVDEFSEKNEHLAYVTSVFGLGSPTRSANRSITIAEKRESFVAPPQIRELLLKIAGKIANCSSDECENVGVSRMHHCDGWFLRYNSQKCVVNPQITHKQARSVVEISRTKIIVRCFGNRCLENSFRFVSWGEFSGYRAVIFPRNH